jgi:hypothetical protein
VCHVCREPHAEVQPVDVKFALGREIAMVFTGPEEVLRQDHIQDQVLDCYEKDLEIMLGICLDCRVQGRRFNHAPEGSLKPHAPRLGRYIKPQAFIGP